MCGFLEGNFNEKLMVLFTLTKNHIFTLKNQSGIIHFTLYFVLIVKIQSFQIIFISFPFLE